MKSLILFFIIAVPAVIAFHHFVMSAIESYESYGEQSHQTRRSDQIKFESFVREQFHRVG